MTVATLPQDTYVGPGVYDMSAEAYFADPVPGGSLSSTGARKLLPPSCPAKFKHGQGQDEAPKKVFDFGTAAHKLVLGNGPELVLVDEARWDTKAIKAQVAEIRERGAVPLKRADYEAVHEMADAIRQHPFAAALFTEGAPEQSLFWVDKATGVTCRARYDWLRSPIDGQLIIPDYKSAASADKRSFEKAVTEFGYHQQDDFYRRGAYALDLADDVQFVFVVQEKEPPYLVNVIQLDEIYGLIAEDRNNRALATYAACMESGIWPGYSDDVVHLTPPDWLKTQHDREYR